MAAHKKVYEVVWDINALFHLKELIEHLSELYSIKFIDAIKKEIAENTTLISVRPKMFPKDKLKDDNDGNYRYFNVPAIRIAYKIEADHIIILRIRHQSQEPLEY